MSPHTPKDDAAASYSLAGIANCTKGLIHILVPGEHVVMGRHPDCTLPITPPRREASVTLAPCLGTMP